MRRLIKYIYFMIIFSFIFNINANAECSYQERKDLLNAAKSVDVSFEVKEDTEELVGFNPNTDEKETFTKIVYKFKMNFIGIKDNFFIRLTNDFNTEELIINYDETDNGYYSLEIDNSTNIIKYYISFYSNNDNCYADNITTKTIKKPKENAIHYFSICSNEKVQNNEYCKQFIDSDFSVPEALIIEKLNSIIEDGKDVEQNNNSFIDGVINLLFSYWYIIIIVLVFFISVILLIFNRRKRSRL